MLSTQRSAEDRFLTAVQGALVDQAREVFERYTAWCRNGGGSCPDRDERNWARRVLLLAGGR